MNESRSIFNYGSLSFVLGFFSSRDFPATAVAVDSKIVSFEGTEPLLLSFLSDLFSFPSAGGPFEFIAIITAKQCKWKTTFDRN